MRDRHPTRHGWVDDLLGVLPERAHRDHFLPEFLGEDGQPWTLRGGARKRSHRGEYRKR
jgi:hypothetical protein